MERDRSTARSGGGPGRARVEKSDRIYTFDGIDTVLHIPAGNEAFRAPGRALDVEPFWPAGWIRQLRNLPRERVEVVEKGENGGVGRLVLRQRGVDTSPREPVFLGEFDREVELEWDLATRRLTHMRRWVYREGERLLFAETESIVYLPRFEEKIYRPELPADVRWGGVRHGAVELLELGPREVALRLFDAAREGDRATLELLCPSPAMVDWLLDERHRSTRIDYIGEPFRAGSYAGVYVPYKVRLGAAPGKIREHDLALRNDNDELRWLFDGGI